MVRGRGSKGLLSGALVLLVALLLIFFNATLAVGPRQVSAAPPPATGLGQWIESTDYGSSSGTSGATGIALNLLSCAAWSGYVYCIGGFGATTPTGDITSKVFYAPLTLSGIGAWTETTDYGAGSGTAGTGGVPINAQSCAAGGGYIYCVGGQTYTSGNYAQVSDVFYAPVSSSGVGAWTETIDYGAASGSSGTGGLQLYRPSCATSSSFIYCVGGVLTAGKGSETFYAQLSSSGVGPWTETTDYGAPSGTSGTGGISPDTSGTSCTVAGGYVYCVGGHGSSVYYAPVSSSGIGGWKETTDYGASSGTSGSGGVQVDATGCASYSSYILCVGGRNASAPDDTTMSRSYFATVSASGVGAWNRTTDYGDAPIIMSNTALFSWYIQPGCTLFGATGAGSYGAGGTMSYITHTVPTPPYCVPATKVTPILYTSLNPSPTITAGGQAYDSAGFVGGSLATPASGTVTYYRYSGPGCTGTKTALGLPVNVNPDGSVPNSAYTTFPTPGMYYYSASYSGDAKNNPTDSKCETLTVVQPISTTTTTTTTMTSSVTTGSSSTSVTSESTTGVVAPPASSSNGSLLWVGIVVALLIIGALGFLFWSRSKKPKVPPVTTEKTPPPKETPTGTTPPDIGPCCGPDITDNVLAGMLKLMQDFFSWDRDAQGTEFGYLTAMTGEPSYNDAWDIEELMPSDSRRAPWEFSKTPVTYKTAKDGYMHTLAPYENRCMKPKDPCDPSVMFLKNCHHPQVVNYVEWGVLARLKEWYDATEGVEEAMAEMRRTGIAKEIPPPSVTHSSYGGTAYSDFHNLRSNTVPGMKDPHYQDQVAMCNVGWRLAEDYITRKNQGRLPYKLSEVNQLALQAILETYEDKSRPTAKCKEGCGKYSPPNAFRYSFGNQHPLRAGLVSEY